VEVSHVQKIVAHEKVPRTLPSLIKFDAYAHFNSHLLSSSPHITLQESLVQAVESGPLLESSQFGDLGELKEDAYTDICVSSFSSPYFQSHPLAALKPDPE